MRWPVRGNLVSSLFFPISIWAGVLIFTGFLFFWNIAPVSAFDSLITYQGKLLNSSGNTVSDGTYYFKYTIYDASSGGTCKYTAAGSCTTPTSTAVTVSGGIFSTNFGAGSLNGFDSQIFGSGSLYLGVTVCTGPGSGCDSEMSPRKQIGAAPYAYNADRLSITTSTAGATAIAPLSNNTYDLGTTSTALKWRYGNFGTAILVGSGTVTSTLDISSLTFAGSATSTIVGVPGADAAGNAAIVLRSNVAISGADLIRIVEGSDPSTNIRFIIDNAGNVGVSSSTPGRTLDVGGSFMVAGNTILGDSASADALTVNAAALFTGVLNASSTFQSTGPARFYSTGLFDGTLQTSSTLLSTGDFSAYSNIYHGDTTSSDVSYFNSRIGSSLIPTANNILDLGEFGRAWQNIYTSGTIRVGTSSTISNSAIAYTGELTVSSTATTTIIGSGGSDAAGNSAILLRSNAAITTADLLRIVEGSDPSTNIRLIIDNAGNVGVSSSTPGRTLDVGGSFMVAGNTILGDSASADTLTINAATSLFGNFNPGTNNTYDLGNTSTPLKWRYGSFGTAVLVGNGTATSTVNPNTVVVWDSTFVGTPSTTLSGGGLSIASQGGASISASGQNLDGTDIDLALSATRNVLIGGYGLAVSSSYGSAGVGLGVSDYFRSYGDNYLGDATTSDKTYFKSRIGDSLIPTANSILDLGEFGRAWRTLYASGTIRLGTAQGETIISSANGFYVSSTSVTVSSTATTTIAGKGSSDNVGNAAIILRGSDQANADILRVYTGLSAMSNPASLMVSANGYVGVTSGTPGARLAVSTGILGEVGMSVAGNSGADISQWYDSASAKAVYINSLGGLFASSTFQSTGATRLYSALTVDGATSLAVGTFSGNVTHGDATSSDVSYFNSRIGSSLIPTANNILDIGEPTRAWRDIYASGTLRVGSTLIIDSGTQTATGSFTLSASGFFTATSSATSTIVGQPGADAAGNAAVLIRSNGPVGTADLLRVAEGPDNISAVRFVIDNAGNVGISSSTPGRTLDVGGSFMVADNTILGDAATSDTVAVNARFLTALVPSTNGQLDLGIAATNYWRTGYFNIGVTVSDNQATSSLAASSLTFSGNSTGTILGAPVTDGAGNSALILRSSSAVSAADILRIQEATTVRFLIDNAGNVGINSSTPGRLLDVGGSFMVADNTILGDAESSDTIAVNARIIGNITPSANDTYDLGATSTNKKFRYGNFSGALSVSNGNSTSTFTTSTISYSNASSTLDIGFTEDTTTIDTAFRVSGPAGTGFDEIQRWNTGGTVRLTLVATSTSRVMFRSNITDSVGAEAYRFDTVQTITSTTAATALDRTLFTVANNGTNKFAISGGGNVYATAGFNANSTQFGIGDVAEYVNLAPGEGQYTEAGDVLMASTELSNKYLRANEAKTKAVAGVVTDTNAFTIGAPGADRVPLALAGFVSVKVTDESGAVEPGDILVASSLPGHAMRYDPDKDDTSMVGVLGVALEKFVSGEGKIKALIKTGWVHSRSATLDTFSKNIVQIANATGISLDTKPKDQVTTASVKTAGGSVTLTGDTLDLLGGSIVNVKSVKSIDGIWEITADGRFVTKGTYGSVVDTSDGPTTLYAQQSPDVEFVLSGSAVLVNGASHVTFDTKAQQYIDPNVQIKVSVTMTSESPGVFVAEKTTSGFTVKEMNSGASSASFDWVAIVRRKGFGPPPALPSAQTSVEAPPVTTTADPSEPTASTDVTPVSVDTAPSETVITSPETVTATSSPDEATATTATDTIIDATTSTPVM